MRLGENSRDYRLGDELDLTLWKTRHWTETVSTHIRLDGKIWDDIHGADPELNASLVPTADPHRRGGKRIDVGLGLNLLSREGDFEGQRLFVEFAMPVYQSLDGPQLETDWTLQIGWSIEY